MKTVVVIQARTGSTRLPGKVLLPVGDRPMLACMLDQVRAAEGPAFALVVATTSQAEDDPIAELAASLDVACFRGHPTDLLDRHYRAALHHGADVVVKIPSDCPLIDPGAIERVLRAFVRSDGESDYTSNLHPQSYPDGNDVEVMRFDALAIAHAEADRPYEREHTTPFLWDQPKRFRVRNVRWETGLDYSLTHRWVVDYPEDYACVRRLYEALHRPGQPIRLQAIIELLHRQQELRQLNASRRGDGWYAAHSQDFRSFPGKSLQAGI